MSNESTAVKSIFSKVKKQNSDLKNKNEVMVKEEVLDKDAVLANYNFDYEVEEEVIDYLKDVTFELHKETHNYYTKIGKLLSEAQDKLANNKSGIFRKWFESIGLKKDFVYDNIGRYKYIVGLSDNIKVEKVESLPVTMTYEISKESCPEFIREKVIDGEIKTKAELKKAIKGTIELEEKVQEAELVEDFEEKIKFDFEIVKQMIAKVEKTCDYSNENFEILEKIKKMLSKM